MTDDVLVKRPSVARPPKKTSVGGAAGAILLLGTGVFFWLSEARAARSQDDGLPALVTTTVPAPAPLDKPAPAAAANPGTSAFFVPNSGPVKLVASPPDDTFGTPPAFRPTQSPPSATASRLDQRLRAPALVVDIAQADPPRTPGSTGSSATGAAAAGQQPAPPEDRNLSSTEQFSNRVGNEEVEVARARQMTGLDRLVPQGAVIGAAMETALNSDLPGYARAIVQRDVYSFDGSSILIPAGSRLIGQYKSGVAQGASRVFVLWTRLIRPDGVSIELASPATDDLGRGGIGGKVNRHFFQRFGGAILTTVLSGGINAASAALSGGSTIVVGNAGQATSLASEATQNNDIPPTITTKPGATIRIFVARDLDFSSVGPAK